MLCWGALLSVEDAAAKVPNVFGPVPRGWSALQPQAGNRRDADDSVADALHSHAEHAEE